MSEKKQAADRYKQYNICVQFKHSKSKLYAIYGSTHMSKEKKIPNSRAQLILGGREGGTKEK